METSRIVGLLASGAVIFAGTYYMERMSAFIRTLSSGLSVRQSTTVFMVLLLVAIVTVFFVGSLVHF